MAIHVKEHRRGKSIVKAYQRQVRVFDTMSKVDRRLRKPPKTVKGVIRQTQLLNLKTRLRSELNTYAKSARDRAFQIQAFKDRHKS